MTDRQQQCRQAHNPAVCQKRNTPCPNGLGAGAASTVLANNTKKKNLEGKQDIKKWARAGTVDRRHGALAHSLALIYIKGSVFAHRRKIQWPTNHHYNTRLPKPSPLTLTPRR